MLIIVAEKKSESYENKAIYFAEGLAKRKFEVTLFNLSDYCRENIKFIKSKKVKNRIYLDDKENISVDYLKEKIKELKKTKKLNVIIMDMRDKGIQGDYEKLSKELKEIPENIGVIMLLNIKENIKDNMVDVENIENQLITINADMIYATTKNENKEKQTYIIKSNNPKFPVGLLKKQKKFSAFLH
ncbi:MAG: hypothetical protein ACLTKT_08180 [Clostridia bacterium]